LRAEAFRCCWHGPFAHQVPTIRGHTPKVVQDAKKKTQTRTPGQTVQCAGRPRGDRARPARVTA
jgi:hypothetical protein